MDIKTHPVAALEKARRCNLDQLYYGTFAEIGAGQEVVRWFFQAGGAAGTIAKSISAYDMKVSDAIYGPCVRYVAQDRLQAMLDHEQHLNVERLGEIRNEETSYFAFADTVSARNYRGTNECHGWMGIKFRTSPTTPDSQIILHVRMLYLENGLQQEALGIVGVNLVYGTRYFQRQPESLIESLLDGLGTHRIEIDLIEFSGESFASVDNRVMSLRLVQLGLTQAAMFSASGKVLQPSDMLYKKPVLVERGRFRPVTHVNLDLVASALRAFESEESGIVPGETVCVMEMTMGNLVTGAEIDVIAMGQSAGIPMSSLLTGAEIDLDDFISRAEILATTGHTVMISNFLQYHELASYLSRYTSRPIGLAMGGSNLREIFNASHYRNLEGGIVENFGRLFRSNLKLLIYPFIDPSTNQLITLDSLEIEPSERKLYEYFVERGSIMPLIDIHYEYLQIHSPDVLRQIGRDNTEWERMVPSAVAEIIKTRHLFGYH